MSRSELRPHACVIIIFINWAIFPAPTLYCMLLKPRVQDFLWFQSGQAWGQLNDTEFFWMETLMQGTTRRQGAKLKIRYHVRSWEYMKKKNFRKVRTKWVGTAECRTAGGAHPHLAPRDRLTQSLKPQGWVLGPLVWGTTKDCRYYELFDV